MPEDQLCELGIRSDARSRLHCFPVPPHLHGCTFGSAWRRLSCATLIGVVSAAHAHATPTVSASTRAPIDANRARAPSSRARGDDATGYAKARARERLSTTDDGRRERRATDGARTDETRTR